MAIKHWVSSLILWLLIKCCLSVTIANLKGKPGEGYYIDVTIGTPPQTFNVLIDTGSTNFAIAAAANPNVDTFFNRSISSSFSPLNKKVSVLYTQGFWDGELGSDVVSFPSLHIPQVQCDVAAIQTSHNFYMNGSKWQGILGLAYPVIARPDRTVVSWLEALENMRGHNLTFSLKLCGPSEGETRHTGVLQMLDNDMHKPADLITSPIVREWFYELLLSGISIGGEAVDLPCRTLNTDKTILDSGTTSLRLPREAFLAVVKLMNSSIPQHSLPLPDDFWLQQKTFCWKDHLNWTLLPNISLSLMHSDNSYFVLELPPQSYIRQASDNTDALGVQNCYKFSIEPSSTGTVLGVVVMEGFQVIFNRSSRTVGFSKSDCGPPVQLSGPFQTADDQKKRCMNPTPPPPVSALTIAAYVVAGLMSIVFVMLVSLVCQWALKSYLVRRPSRSSSETSLMTDD